MAVELPGMAADVATAGGRRRKEGFSVFMRLIMLRSHAFAVSSGHRPRARLDPRMVAPRPGHKKAPLPSTDTHAQGQEKKETQIINVVEANARMVAYSPLPVLSVVCVRPSVRPSPEFRRK